MQIHIFMVTGKRVECRWRFVPLNIIDVIEEHRTLNILYSGYKKYLHNYDIVFIAAYCTN